MTTAYLAARYDRRQDLLLVVPLLEAVGIGVKATWLHGTHEGATDPSLLAWCAQEDLADVAQCDMLVFFSEHPDVGFTSGGRHVELGYALGRRKRVVVIGPVENVFHHGIERYESLGAFLDRMVEETGEGAHDWTTWAALTPSGADQVVAPYCYRCGADAATMGGPCPKWTPIHPGDLGVVP